MTQIIRPGCVEELNQVVEPWQLTLRQLSSDHEPKRVRFTCLKDILVTNERWSCDLLGHGGTARDFITIVGNSCEHPVYWQGQELFGSKLAVAPANAECEFHTPGGADHWVILIPRQNFTEHFQLESESEIIQAPKILACPPGIFRALSRLVGHIFDDTTSGDGDASGEELRSLLLARVADLFESRLPDSGDHRSRYNVFRMAIEAAEASPSPLTVQQLSDAAEASPRVLELAFRENLQVTPHRFLKLLRLNRLHGALLETSRDRNSVTEVMDELGFSEYGRTSVQFREVFHKRPSEVIRDSTAEELPSFLDLAKAQAR